VYFRFSVNIILFHFVQPLLFYPGSVFKNMHILYELTFSGRARINSTHCRFISLR